jgi:hypothetical protein
MRKSVHNQTDCLSWVTGWPSARCTGPRHAATRSYHMSGVERCVTRHDCLRPQSCCCFHPRDTGKSRSHRAQLSSPTMSLVRQLETTHCKSILCENVHAAMRMRHGKTNPNHPGSPTPPRRQVRWQGIQNTRTHARTHTHARTRTHAHTHAHTPLEG